MWQAPLVLFLLYCELFSDHELFTNRELRDAPTSALPHVTHALCVASSARYFFLLYHELFTNHELRDTRILAPPHVTHALGLASSACSFSIVP